MTILDRILAEKRIEVAKLRQQKVEITGDTNRKKRSFIAKLQEADQLSIIAEFKRASPSKGDINIGKDAGEQTLAYTRFGADAISVLTDRPFFKGTIADLQRVSEVVDVPVLCKDFIIDEVQILRAKQAGADLILLIVAALEEARLQALYDFAIEQELEVLMEVHNEEEAVRALATGTKIVGVNNRDLKTFTVDLSITERLAPMIKKAGVFLISESGIKTVEDVQRVTAAGANGILVGEAFMTAENLETVLTEMKLPLVKGPQK